MKFLYCACFVSMSLLTQAVDALELSTPGTYSIGANCGFTADTTGWVRLRLTGDAASTYSDLRVNADEEYPLALAEVTILPSSSDGAAITVNTSTSCTCDRVLDPVAPSGTCYTHSLGVDYCEDAAPDETSEGPGPNPDLGLEGAGFYGSAEGAIQYLNWSQGDYGEYWQGALLREGQWSLGAPRRCRFVDGSALTYITVIGL